MDGDGVLDLLDDGDGVPVFLDREGDLDLLVGGVVLLDGAGVGALLLDGGGVGGMIESTAAFFSFDGDGFCGSRSILWDKGGLLAGLNIWARVGRRGRCFILFLFPPLI